MQGGGAPNPLLILSCTSHLQAARSRQLERRAALLAGSRRLMIEDGLSGFSLRRLSEISGTTPQTIYNNFGSRDEVILAAMMDYGSALISRCDLVDTDEFPIPMFKLWLDCAVEYPDYLKATVQMIYARGEVFTRLHDQAATWLASRLPSISIQSASLAAPDRFNLARQLSSLCTVACYEWSAGMISIEDFRQRISLGPRVFFGAGRIH